MAYYVFVFKGYIPMKLMCVCVCVCVQRLCFFSTLAVFWPPIFLKCLVAIVVQMLNILCSK